MDLTASPLPLPAAERLAGMRRGIEKESLRTDADGRLAMSPHPVALGAALTHPCITTDFSESQLELITAPHAHVDECLAELRRIHQFTCREIGLEQLWVASMPCGLPGDDTIPIGRYGSSNIGRMKSVYRTGLGHRYGRRMQTISGIHYNWSLPGLRNDDYLALIRNFRRHAFLLLVLFGASPALCTTFLDGRAQGLQPLGRGSLYRPHATSLRMGRLGYQSDAQAALAVSYNNLESYAASLQQAMTTPYPPYEAIGLFDATGNYQQLATSLLQIENEFYGTIRPKRSIHRGERPLHALRERGIEYVEVRCMDLDPFEPVGIAASTMRFIDVFLLHCLLAPSPPDTPDEAAALGRNQQLVAAEGRRPGLRLERPDGRGDESMVDWGTRLLDGCLPLAVALDELPGDGGHVAAVQDAMASLAALERTPSARVLTAIADEHDGIYVHFIREQSARLRREVLGWAWDDATAEHFRRLARVSIDEQMAREADDDMPFETFRQHYLSPERLWPSQTG